MACLKKEGKFEGSGKQRMFKSPIINKCVRGKVDESSSCCKRLGRIAVTSTSYSDTCVYKFFLAHCKTKHSRFKKKEKNVSQGNMFEPLV